MTKKEAQLKILDRLNFSEKGKELLERFKEGITSEVEIDDDDFIILQQINVLRLLKSYPCNCEIKRSDFVEIDNMILSLWKEYNK